MKRYLFILLLLIIGTSVFAQQFTSYNFLLPGRFSLGVNPVLVQNANFQSGIYLHGSTGLNSKTNLDVKVGVLEGSDYYGGDIEFLLRDTDRMSLSLIGGAHVKHFFGLDAGISACLPLSKKIVFFTGLDMDLNFETEIYHYTWIPIGLEAAMSQDVSLIFEIDFPVSEWAWNIYGGGLVFYI